MKPTAQLVSVTARRPAAPVPPASRRAHLSLAEHARRAGSASSMRGTSNHLAPASSSHSGHTVACNGAG